ncbi:MAG: hypothetical protein Q9221_005755 [Calogaya cf. arnoldii]
MSDHADFDENASRRTYTAPYTSRHPVPTVQKYEDQLQDRDQHSVPAHSDGDDSTNVNKKTGFIAAAKERLLSSHAASNDTPTNQQPYESANRHLAGSGISNGQHEDPSPASSHKSSSQDAPDTSETIAASNDPREKRKIMKKMNRDNKGREVTDPITHLPITIHDATSAELSSVPENEVDPAAGGKNHEQQDAGEQRAAHHGMEALFPPPSLEVSGEKLASIVRNALTAGLGSMLAIILLLLLSSLVYHSHSRSGGESDQTRGWAHLLITSAVLLSVGALVGIPIILGIRFWVGQKVTALWEDDIWDAAQTREQEASKASLPESVQWLNSLLASVWPLINPDLFASLADTVEDVMQASLPKFVRMMSVSDLGQGNGIKWLPTGNAKKDVSVDGQVQEQSHTQEIERKVPNEKDNDTETESHNTNENAPSHSSKAKEADSEEPDEDQAIAGGMEAEEGNFVNVEVGFSYRASNTGTSIKVKAKNAHLYLLFYLPGGIRFPVWVELRGMVGTMRMRLQLCPDPPFVALCTLTLLGQPKVDLLCTPLTRKGLNIMDLPLISSFVQSSIDAALAEYVAPKSLTLDLKDMLVGDDFKKDTSARGVLVVTIVSATEFKEGDSSLGPLKKGSSDAYVAVGWGKFGKPVWSTRIILGDMRPSWNETAYILVGPEEINASERLRVQLWDSDRTSADDDLGRIEVDLGQLMSDSRSSGRMWQREDGFRALTPSENMPGTLLWNVGYFPKQRIQQEQLENQSIEPEIKSLQQLKDKVASDVGRKMREASDQKDSEEFNQQEAQDLKTREADNMVASIHPLHDSPMGILSLQIHQISGLELERINKPRADEEMEGDTAEGSDEVPSSYCTVILNHQKIFKTRTKPKSSNPFFNAGTERFVRDWRNTEIMVSVRDARVHENHPLLHQPPSSLGWDYGTLEVTTCASASDKLPASLHELRLKLRTSIARGKMYRASDEDRQIHWQGKHDQPIRLAVQQRYRSCLVIEFRKNRLGLDQTPAFAVLWLQKVTDEQQQSITLPIYGGNGNDLERAESNYSCDLGEPLGSVTVTLKFWRGLGRYHHRLGKHNGNVRDVLEVLDTALDNREVQSTMAENDDNDSEESSSSDSSDSDEDSTKVSGGFRSQLKARFSGDKGMEGKGNSPLKEFQDYNEHSDQLHRHHRGLMQWKVRQGARTAKWMKTRIEDGKDKIANSLKHHDRNPGIETEV